MPYRQIVLNQIYFRAAVEKQAQRTDILGEGGRVR